MTTPKPPGPKGFFNLKFINDFRSEPLSFLLNLRKTYGETVYARMGPYQSFFFFHPDAVKDVLVKKVKQLPKFRIQVKVLSQWDGNGLLLSEGDFWAQQHRLVQPAFQTKRFEGYVTLMLEETSKMAKVWESFPATKAFNIEEAMTTLTLNIIAKTLFGAKLPGDPNDLAKAVHILSETAVFEMAQVIHLPNWVPLPRIRKKVWATKFLHSTIQHFIAERRRTGEDLGDLLSMLLHAVDSEDSKTKMTDLQAQDEAMVLFLAGHDTTASALTWFWYALARYPEVQEKAFEEVKSVLQNRTPKFIDVPNLKYLTAVIKETLRLYPPAIGVFAREATEDIQINGVEVPKRSIVYVFSYVTHRDAKWFPNPERFDPTRFLGENEKNISPFAYFPFGVGPRACIGAQFAMTEMLMVASLLLQKFKFSLAPTQGEPIQQSLMSLRPKGGISLTVAKRQ